MDTNEFLTELDRRTVVVRDNWFARFQLGGPERTEAWSWVLYYAYVRRYTLDRTFGGDWNRAIEWARDKFLCGLQNVRARDWKFRRRHPSLDRENSYGKRLVSYIADKIPNPSRGPVCGELIERMRKEFEDLPPKLREALELTELAELSPAQARVDLSAHRWIKSYRRRALCRLASRFGVKYRPLRTGLKPGAHRGQGRKRGYYVV